jgi:UDP-2-acetamido-3-amino-2,3-dideoxy-glucuronate N-acetyltransferase
MIDQTAFIHPKAHVDNATIGPRTRVWQFASVIRGAVLGADCTVASGACFDGSRAGDRTILCHNLAAGPGFWLGDDVFIGPNVTLCNDAWPRTYKDGFDPSRFDGAQWAIIIEDGASIGAGSTILPGVRIGAGAMVAAGSVVTVSVPPGRMFRDGHVRGKVDEERGKVMRMKFAQEFAKAL